MLALASPTRPVQKLPLKPPRLRICTDFAAILELLSTLSTTAVAPASLLPVSIVMYRATWLQLTVCVVPASWPLIVTCAVKGGSEPGGCGVVCVDEHPAVPATSRIAAPATARNRFC